AESKSVAIDSGRKLFVELLELPDQLFQRAERHGRRAALVAQKRRGHPSEGSGAGALFGTDEEAEARRVERVAVATRKTCDERVAERRPPLARIRLRDGRRGSRQRRAGTEGPVTVVGETLACRRIRLEQETRRQFLGGIGRSIVARRALDARSADEQS